MTQNNTQEPNDGSSSAPETVGQRFTVERRKLTRADFHVVANNTKEAFAQVREGTATMICEDEKIELVIRDVPIDSEGGDKPWKA